MGEGKRKRKRRTKKRRTRKKKPLHKGITLYTRICAMQRSGGELENII
jgi:hypothetical protein